MYNEIDMKETIDDSFCQYAGAVLQSRALVDVRDCLKPSARQIFFCLYNAGFLDSKPYHKTLSAIGKSTDIYIHGDASAEGIMIRSGQDFAMRNPLMDISGNTGTLQKSGNWAAPRYTECRLSGLTTKLFEDLKKDTIEEWRNNYDDTIQYPSVLPSKGFYNIVNGSLGIGVGAGSMIPQFNLKDVNKALETLLTNPDASFEDIYCQPDFATGGYLINEPIVKNTLKYGNKENAEKAGVKEAGACKLRAVIDYDKKDNCLIVKELPYSVYTNTICEQLEAIIEDEEHNPGIDRFNDLTSDVPLIKIYLHKGIDPDRVQRFLYKNTSLEYYFGINLTMLGDNGRFPKVFTWKEALQEHIDHECVVYRRGFEFDIKKINSRIHILDGIIICLASIDEVIKTIKNSSSTADAKINLISKFKLDDEQATAVLDMKLARLSHLEVEKIKKEKNELATKRDNIQKILDNKELFNNELIKGWKDIANKYGDDHRTKVITVTEPANEEKEIEQIKAEEVVVITTQNGFIKRVPASSFKVQKRNGVGIKSADEVIMDTCKTNTIDIMMFFTDKGKMYRLLVNDIPSGNNTSKGINIGNLIQLDAGEKVISVSSLHRKSLPQFAIFITKNGMIKKSLLSEYTIAKRNSGVAAIKLQKEDSVAKVIFQDNEEIMVFTKNSMAIRFETEKIAPIGRNTAGVKAINLKDGDSVLTALPIHKYSDNLFLAFDGGFGKRVNLDEFSVQGRGGKGVSIGKEVLAGAAMVSDTDNILICGATNTICIAAKDVPISGRTTQGVGLIKGNIIKSIAKI